MTFRDILPTENHRRLDALCANIWAQAEGLSIVVEEESPLAIERAEIAMAVLVAILQRFLGQRWLPEVVTFSRAPMIGMLRGAHVDDVARQLGMNRRTLHRRLARQGTSFSELLQRERTKLAQYYIDAGNRSLTEIADLLGFSCLSAFSRRKQRALARPASDN